MNELKNRACSAEVPASRRRKAGLLAIPNNPKTEEKAAMERALARARETMGLPSLHPAPEPVKTSSSVPMKRYEQRHA